MQFWTLWKYGSEREPNGELAAHLVACTDSFEALARRGAQRAAQIGGDNGSAREWTEWPLGSRRYRLGTEGDGAYMVIEPDIASETVWEPAAEALLPAVEQWPDEDIHSLR